MAQFLPLLNKILLLEGGFTANPSDHGGPTNMGITLSTWHRTGYDKDGDGDIDEHDLALLTRKDVSVVLRYFYWNRWCANAIESQPVAEILVDWLWCSGRWGIVIPQRILGVTPDGFAGNKTITAVNQTDSVTFHRQILEHRLDFINEIVRHDPSQSRFRKGWINRLKQFTIKGEVVTDENIQ